MLLVSHGWFKEHARFGPERPSPMGSICVLNAGSSTLKYAVYATEPTLRRLSGGNIEGGALDRVPIPNGVTAFGHRVVHGGPDLTQPVPIDPPTMARIEAVSRRAAGGMFRHIVPSRASGGGRSVRHSRCPISAGRAPLRLPRTVLRTPRRRVWPWTILSIGSPARPALWQSVSGEWTRWCSRPESVSAVRPFVLGFCNVWPGWGSRSTTRPIGPGDRG